ALVLLQIAPLRSQVISVISPATAQTKTQLLSDLPGASEHLRRMTLSFYAESTLRQFRLLVAVSAVFVVVVNIYQRIDAIRRLLIAITTIGAAVALLALAQDITRSGQIYWTIEVYGGLAKSGPFVNHSHFSQIINLSTVG